MIMIPIVWISLANPLNVGILNCLYGIRGPPASENELSTNAWQHTLGAVSFKNKVAC
jgi:hypothetical protein